MRFGLRAILLIVAIILFIVAALSDENAVDMLAFGLAVFAAAFVVDDLGLANRVGGARDRT